MNDRGENMASLRKKVQRAEGDNEKTATYHLLILQKGTRKQGVRLQCRLGCPSQSHPSAP